MGHGFSRINTDKDIGGGESRRKQAVRTRRSVPTPGVKEAFRLRLCEVLNYSKIGHLTTFTEKLLHDHFIG